MPAAAQNGVSDDRVSLPDGPGSVGGVGDNVDINPNMGSSSYSVAIRVPEDATEAMTPRLALGYSSGAGLGAAGIGWDLSAPAIERMTSKGLPEYDTDDLFMADGSELVFVGDVAGVRHYRARFEGTFVRYRWFGAAGGAAGYWTAEYPDGRIGYFGADASGALVASARVTSATDETFRYHLVEVVDTVGRRVVHTYAKTNGWPRLASVQYGFGPLVTPRFSISVQYEARPDKVRNATPGHVITLDQRVSRVEVFSLAQRIRYYELTYEDAADSGGMSRLASVQEHGRDGGALPIAHTFRYSRSLDGLCDVGCERAFLVDMGTLAGGVSMASGRAALIDINGDSLPDVVASDQTGAHTFYVSTLTAEGRAAFASTPVTSTMGGTNLRFVLGAPNVQLLDVNGDGLTDVVDQLTGTALCNFGGGDWASAGCAISADQLPTLEDDVADAASEHDPLGARFFDYDYDKRIDLLRTPAPGTTEVYANTGAGFQQVTVAPLGAQFDVNELQLADMNADGLLDPVELIANGSDATLRYWLNLGFGRWEPSVDVTLPGLDETALDSAVLQDLDGDGLDDVVVVASNTVSYWRNLNADVFAPRVDIVAADVDGGIPVRDDSQTVLFADMNANGTDDIVYLSTAGQVQFVELFPVRPNLLARVENGIGWIRTLTYGTAAAERARDAGTSDAWRYTQPNAMIVVREIDTWVTLTGGENQSGLHDLTRFRYRDGYYDPAEKSFKGFERVARELVADPVLDSQDPSLELLTFDVGVTDLYRAGQLVRSQTFGGPDLDVPMRESRTELADCDLGPSLLGPALSALDPPVRFICPEATVEVMQEGAPESEWATVRSEYEYDIFGNVTLERMLGVVHRGPPESPLACAACEGPAGLHSGACGAMCTGDEMTTETTYVVPGAQTGDAWLLRLPVRGTRFAVSGGDEEEVFTYYDGPDFVGLPAGQATRGLITRVTLRSSADKVLPVQRFAWDGNGNVSSTLEANASVSDPTARRRDYAYDEHGLRVTRVTVRAGDYDLVQEVLYESSFLLPSEATDFFVVDGGVAQTNRNSSLFRYDEHGRVTAIIRPGDSGAAPTSEISYELADPVSRVVNRTRRTPGGALEVESAMCLDGRGRDVQTRQRVGASDVIVNGFNEVNSRNAPVRTFQPYSATSLACDLDAPSGVLASTFRYDALGRLIESTAPDASLYGTASTMRREYEPLRVVELDEEDADPDSPHAGTPLRRELDGLGRLVQLERLLTSTSLATYRVAYDDLGRAAQVIDPGGNVQTQAHDLASRVLSVSDPNTGTTTFTYDDASQVLERTDARGARVAFEYDALNRVAAVFDPTDREATLEQILYDLDPACTDCRNGAGRQVGLVYAAGADAYGYDPRGRMVFQRRTLEGTDYTTTYAFDGVDELVSATYPDGQRLDYEHDLGSRVTSIDGFIDDVEYDERGQLARIVRFNGVDTVLGHDARMRRERTAHGGFFDVSYERDRVGNLLSLTDAGSGVDRALTAVYDSWYRLTGTTLHDGEVVTVGYDLTDNIVSQTSSRGGSGGANVGTYTYESARPNMLVTAGDLSLTHDEAGYLTTRGALSLTWDHQGRLVGASAPGKPDALYTYAAVGSRVMKEEEGGVTVYPSPGFIVRDGIASLYVEAGGEVVARGQTKVLAEAQYDRDNDGDLDVADVVAGSTDERGRLLRAVARRVLFDAGDASVGLHEDHRGSLVALSSAAGDPVAERDFLPFGEERMSGGFVDELGFSGEEHDLATGLVHFEHRPFDGALGRFTASDPMFAVLSAGSLDALGEATPGYAYVANNPLNSVDPTGLFAKRLVRAIKNKHYKKHLKKRAIRDKAELSELTQVYKASKGWEDKNMPGGAARQAAKDIRDARRLKLRLKAAKYTAIANTGARELHTKERLRLREYRDLTLESLKDSHSRDDVTAQMVKEAGLKHIQSMTRALMNDRARAAGIQSATPPPTKRVKRGELRQY